MNDFHILNAIRCSLVRLARAMGDQWPAFQEAFEKCLQHLDSAPADQVSTLVDEVLEIGFRSGAAPIFREILQQLPASESSVRSPIQFKGIESAASESDQAIQQVAKSTLRALDQFGTQLNNRNLPVEIARDTDRRTSSRTEAEAVDCAVYAPPSVAAGQMLLVQLFAFDVNGQDEVTQLAEEFDPETQRRGFKSLDLDIAPGCVLDVHLELPGLLIDEPEQQLVWRSRTESLQFGVDVPLDRRPGTCVGKVTVALDGLPVGKLRFALRVEADDTSAPPCPLGELANRYRRAFVSYSSQDRAEVLKRVQMLKVNGIEFFQDVLNLEPGQRWESQLYREIDNCDVFYLFWSSAAKDSPWVQKEARYAWDRKKGDDDRPPEIVPIPVEGPPIPTPPDFLQHLHFNDALLAHIAVSQGEH